ncbi:hypothetical protein B0A50_04575 [Salinomyces thailandicus]|uniref:Mitochondrial carrier protein n=1 Tax=Salinomyces thailandicus TaxID=706561 RepID=A0A4U0TXT3_9PEZI|nr:hypothetical protein B0A50_04575 [Salinomyces thailandica]
MADGEGVRHEEGPPSNTVATATTGAADGTSGSTGAGTEKKRQASGLTNEAIEKTKRALRRNPSFGGKIAILSTHVSEDVVNAFSGGVGGIVSGIAICPLDVIKTKLQAQGSFSRNPYSSASAAGPPPTTLYRGLFGTARTIVKADGVTGLYRGLSPMLLGYLPTWAVYMTVYNRTRDTLYRNGYAASNFDTFVAQIYSALAAGGCSTLTTNPIWVVKTRLMSQSSSHSSSSAAARTPWNYTSTFNAFTTMYRVEGLKSFYSGLTPALLGLTHVAIQFPLYEYFKLRFTGVEMGAAPPDSKGPDGKNALGSLAATLIAKVTATTATYPHEVLRTRMQTQQRLYTADPKTNGGETHPQQQNHSRSLLRTFRTILREEGWKAMYRGMGTNMLRAVPAAMTTMLTYESVKGGLERVVEQGLVSREDEAERVQENTQ